MEVVFVASMSRSGSTLVDMLLGQQAGFWSGGELKHLWTRGLKDNVVCTCGQCFYDCPFWIEIGRRGYGGWENVDVERHLANRARVERHRYLPLLIKPTKKFSAHLEPVLSDLDSLYRALQEVTQTDVLVDSSKDPPYLLLLRHLGRPLRQIHMVRDPRGVVYSWRKLTPRNDGSELNMRTQSAGRSSIEWMDYNSVFHLAEHLGVPRMFIRYEDFVSNPEMWLTSMVEFASNGRLHDPLADIHERHMIGGNPHRFRPLSEIRLDEKWKREMAPSDRRRATLMTLPLLLRYGYPL